MVQGRNKSKAEKDILSIFGVGEVGGIGMGAVKNAQGRLR